MLSFFCTQKPSTVLPQERFEQELHQHYAHIPLLIRNKIVQIELTQIKQLEDTLTNTKLSDTASIALFEKNLKHIFLEGLSEFKKLIQEQHLQRYLNKCSFLFKKFNHPVYHRLIDKYKQQILDSATIIIKKTLADFYEKNIRPNFLIKRNIHLSVYLNDLYPQIQKRAAFTWKNILEEFAKAETVEKLERSIHKKRFVKKRPLFSPYDPTPSYPFLTDIRIQDFLIVSEPLAAKYQKGKILTVSVSIATTSEETECVNSIFFEKAGFIEPPDIISSPVLLGNRGLMRASTPPEEQFSPTFTCCQLF